MAGTRFAVALLVASAAAFSGCGDAGGGGSGPVPQPPAPEYTEAEVMAAANIVEGCDEWGRLTVGPCTKKIEGTDEVEGIPAVFHRQSRCEIAVVLTSPQEVELYAGAGDNVASNPDRTVGVKITAADEDEQRCHQALTAALAEVG